MGASGRFRLEAVPVNLKRKEEAKGDCIDMLNIIYGEVERAVYNTSIYFKYAFRPE